MKKPQKGDIYKHFKNKYYVVITLAHHTETDETMVVYKALYGEHEVCARPLDMFMSKVDKDKYPNVEQEYRFEYVGCLE